MQSDGGLTPVDSFSGHKGILSGPAGGVVGYAKTALSRLPAAEGEAAGAAPRYQPVVGFDMGGTSTDVSRYAGRYEQVGRGAVRCAECAVLHGPPRGVCSRPPRRYYSATTPNTELHCA
jgi:N-methylhydantoinase A/oxoprolinase/acetone carboxylase beta subunit